MALRWRSREEEGKKSLVQKKRKTSFIFINTFYTTNMPAKTAKTTRSKTNDKDKSAAEKKTKKTVSTKTNTAPSSPKMVRFEKLDPKTHRFLFDIKRVYPDSKTELSFEELMAVRWNKKKKKEEEKARTAKLQQEVELLRNQLEKLTKHLEKGITVEDRTPLKDRNRNDNKSSMVHTTNSVVLDAFDDPTTGIVPVVRPSKPCFEIFRDDPTAPVIEEVTNVVPVVLPKKPAFDIFVDEPTVAVETSKVVQVQPPKKPGFEIFVDEPTVPLEATQEPVVKPKKPAFEIFVDEPTAPLEATQEPVVKPKKPTFEIFVDEETEPFDEKESLHDSKAWLLELSANPIRGAQMVERPESTFLLPSETEFISLRTGFSASTPAVSKNKKTLSRVKAPVQKEPEITGKLDTIVETSREYKSSSSSSGAYTTTGGFTRTRSRLPSSLYDVGHGVSGHIN